MATGAESDVTVGRVSYGEPVRVRAMSGAPSVIVVCEHASHRIPAGLDDLGVSQEVATSHVAWDPGALAVSEHLAQRLSAVLVQGTLSRLVYDCNRPPDAPSAIPEQSEVYDIPGNRGLSPEARAERIAAVYAPFTDALAQQIATHRATLDVMVTIHSFTPVFHGVPRGVQIGILHGQDAGFAHAMLATAPRDATYDIRLNEPYAASDGVAHTLDHHGARTGLPNVMIEIRNDLITTPAEQAAVAEFLGDWIKRTLDDQHHKERAS